MIDKSYIRKKIETYLKTIPEPDRKIVQVAFFGGSFTSLPENEQIRYLESVQPFIKQNKIRSIRISTRPDYINPKTIKLLKKYKVKCIELGVQSFSDKILKKSKRGHTRKDIIKASQLIKKSGLKLGHQLMVGLPSSKLQDEINSVIMSIKLKADEARLYPVLVIKNTYLEKMYTSKKYAPLSENQAIPRTAKLLALFEKNNITVLRCGLHPSENLLSGRDILSGPFHPAFRQKVDTHIYGTILSRCLQNKHLRSNIKIIKCSPKDEHVVKGYDKKNVKFLQSKSKWISINKDKTVKKGTIKLVLKNGKVKTIKKEQYLCC